MTDIAHGDSDKEAMTSVPKQWLERDYFDMRIAWLSKTPTQGTLELEEEMRRDLRERGRLEQAETFSLEISGHPGWWLFFNSERKSCDELGEALAQAKTVLKRSDLGPGSFNFEAIPKKTPVRLSKSQRVNLIDQIMNSPRYKPPEGIVREAFLELGDYALSVWIEHIPLRDEFQSPFSAPENPLRSLTGQRCKVEGLAFGEDGDEVESWQLLGEGVLSLEGTQVQVGEWSHSFDESDDVLGTAYLEAFIDAEALEMTLLFSVPNAYGED